VDWGCEVEEGFSTGFCEITPEGLLEKEGAFREDFGGGSKDSLGGAGARTSSKLAMVSFPSGSTDEDAKRRAGVRETTGGLSLFTKNLAFRGADDRDR
jgi:hypothetical protein